MDERKEFEAWARTQADSWLIVGGLTWSPGTGDYASARTNAAWTSWQARAALAAQPAASAEPSDKSILKVADEVHQTGWDFDDVPDGLLIEFARALLSRYGKPAGDAQPVAWLHQCRKKPELRALSFNKDEPNLKALGYAPIPLAPVAAQKADDADPLQGAADWLVKALAKPRPTEIAARLLIGYNRAKRLFDAAIAQQRKGDV